MKRFIILSLFYLLFANMTYAQTDYGRLNRNVENAVMKAVAEAEAKAKKEKAEKERQERERAMRHEQQNRQHEAKFNSQMNNLNQVSAEDFLNNPQHDSGFSSKVNKFREEQQTPIVVTTPKKESDKRTNRNPFGNSGIIGTPSYSGLNYTGNRYDNKRAGFGNTQKQSQTRVQANQIRGQYKPHRKMYKGVVNLQRTNAVPKAKVQVPQQQGNIAQRPQQERETHSARNVQPPQRQKAIVLWQKKTRVNENHDTSNDPVYVTLQQNNSSSDLAMVDTKRIDYATKVNNITVYNVPEEAYYLSDKDNKITSGNVKGMANDERTLAKQALLMKKDAMNGFSSFNNRKEWEFIYDYGYARTVKMPSKVLTQKR